MSEFQAFGPVHGAALSGIAIASVLLAWHGRRNGGRSAAARPAGVVFAIEWVVFHAWKATPPDLNPIETLPLQMCHWTSLAAALYLATRWRALRPLLYFWGLGLCTQALLTPVLKEGPADPIFWHFWTSHGLIVVAATYALVAEGYRPSWRDYRLACLATLVYGLAVLPVDLYLGANYGFLGRSRPDQPTIVDLLGPWPERIVAIVLIVGTTMALLAWPWQRHARVR